MERLLYLDGLRGGAAVIVYFNHFAAAFFPAIIFGRESMVHVPWERAFYATPLGFVTNGNFAVHLFIALSAFVILRKVGQASFTPRLTMLVGRYLRLMLPIAASTLVAYALMRWSAGVHASAAQLTLSPWLAWQWPVQPEFFGALRQGVWDALWMNASTYNSNLWMIHYIWYGSLIVLCIGAFVRWSWARVVVYTVGLFLTWTTVFSGFWMGALLFHFYERIHDRVKQLPNRSALAVFLLTFGILLGSVPIVIGDIPSVYTLLTRVPFSLPVFINSLHLVGAFFTLGSVLVSPRVQDMLSVRPLVSLGRLGYATYLLHPLLITSLASWLVVQLVAVPYQIAVGWAFLITTVALVGSSILFQRFVENPSKRFSRWVASR